MVFPARRMRLLYLILLALCLCRNRMQGKAVLYLPGCDHAGIATQAVVEKKLKRERNITRHDMGREAFVAEVWKWKEQYGHRIYDQIRRIGASADWDRACFTLDPMLNRAVVEAFVRMFNEGLIFRANRLVNWCGKLKTSLSDLEVEMKEIEGGALFPAHGHDPKKKYRFGMMTYFAYRIEGGASGEEIVIATTRPETLFADTALCINPKDPRYIAYHGKRAIHPVLDKVIPIICDEAADPEFGTGALKVSPAHDHVDFALGQNHGLEFVVIYDENNVLNENCGKFAGMARYDAREAVIEHCRQNGTLRDEKPYPMSIPVCSRSGDFVEPRLIPQWWLNCKSMAAASVEAVRTGALDIWPKEHEKIWYHWLNNIKDWCLSRQLWWGHRIPAYRVLVEGRPRSKRLEDEIWVAAHTPEDALRLARERLPEKDPSIIRVEQDEDVLDTWFSSGLWPFSTLGWPEQTPDMSHFYPNQLMETGGDILFFWVARMVMMGIHLTGKIPFSKIFLHAIVRDAHGRKMSKSLGNVIDPLDVIEGITLAELQTRLDQGNLDVAEVRTAKEGQKRDFPHGIPQCGTDALRFALCSYIAEGRDINMNVNRVEGYRRFCNKLWNAVKFALLKLGENSYVPEPKLCLYGNESLADRWILSRLNKAIDEANRSLSVYNLMSATQAIHGWWLYDLCDVYIETIKPICSDDAPDAAAAKAARNTLYTCLEQGLRLLHPFMPFVTEELYQRLPRRPSDTIETISLTSYPHRHDEVFAHEEAEASFSKCYELIKTVRRLASETKVARNARVQLKVVKGDDLELLQSQEQSLGSLIRSIGTLSISREDGSAANEKTIALDGETGDFYVHFG